MVFPSVPVYLDLPSWNQQQAHQAGGSTGGAEVAQQLPPPPQPGPVPRPEAGMVGSIRANSMTERARLAKVPQPELALKCPRCDSTNTKFCYFNNYSLSQPRHFCKTCRRYWTNGGALRNVPVGGGCRRNKRSKSSGSSSKSSASTSDRQFGASSSSSSSTGTSARSGAIPSSMLPMPQLPFMTSLHPLPDYGGASNIGPNFTGIQPIGPVDYQAGSSSSIGLEQWRFLQIQQFPFLGGLEPPHQPPAPVAGLFPLDSQGGVGGGQYSEHVHAKASSSGLITQLASVKMEDTPQALDLTRQYLGVPRNDQYWGGGVGGGNTSGNTSGGGGSGWPADLSGFNSSSSGNLL